MTPDVALVLAVLAGTLTALALTRIPPDAILVGALAVLLAAPLPAAEGWRVGVLRPEDALAGFANPGLAVVALLFVVVAGLRETGAVDWLAQAFLGRPRSLRGALLRIVTPVIGTSAFLNNTPVVAMLIPAVSDWAKRLRIAPSKLMIPLSYAAILGGSCTLIGTSTNLVVAGLMESEASLPSMGLFDITRVGLPCALVGALFLILAGPRLLPSRGSATSALADPREYTLELLVPPGSPLAGRTIEQAGLRNLPGCYLVEIERGGEILSAVGPDQGLAAGDRLLFAGVVESIRDLSNLRGLAPATDQVFKLDSPRYRRRLFEAVVSPSCPMVGRSIRLGRFRTRYDGAVIAVARNGERLRGKIGDIELRPGDTLLVEADPDFDERQRNSRDFLLVSALVDSTPRRHDRAPLALALLLGLVVTMGTGWLPLVSAALLTATAMVLLRCCTVAEARRSIDWSVLLVIGAALALGKAMETSGTSAWIAHGLLAPAAEHPWLALAVVYAITSILTEVITNNAAVALMFPLAQVVAGELGVSFLPFAIALMMAGSASFATPIGYQTNLMVYGPGGYRFTDFLRIGLPMNVLMGTTAVILTPLMFPF